MGKSKKGKKKSVNALKRYWKILGLIRREYAKNKIRVNITELRQETSRVYPLLKDLPNNRISREKVLNATKDADKPQKIQKKKRKEQPYIKAELLEKVEYFVAANDYPQWIDESSSEARFLSKISPEGYEEFYGGSVAFYEDYFKNFTAHCNNLELTGTDDPNMPYVVVVPEYLDDEDDWVFNIVSVDESGNENDFGFDPTEPLQEFAGVRTERKEKELENKKESENVRLAEIELKKIEEERRIKEAEAKIKEEERKIKEIEVEARRKSIQESFEKKLITFNQYIKALKNI